MCLYDWATLFVKPPDGLRKSRVISTGNWQVGGGGQCFGAEKTRSQPAPASQAGETCLRVVWGQLGEEAVHCDHTCPRNEVDGIAHPSA